MKRKKPILNPSIKKMMNLLFEKELYRNLLDFKNKKVLIAFSGGKDSLALLDFMARYKDILEIHIGACHINHGIRENAIRDELFCINFCHSISVPVHVENIKNDMDRDKKYGIEDSARRYRYKALNKVLQKNKYDLIFTAHTYDDQVESFFVDLYTGASIFSIGGIFNTRNNIFRPMLNITSAMVLEYLNYYLIEPTFDESNDDLRFMRNNIRHSLIPHLYKCGNSFVNSIFRIQNESKRIYDYFYNKVKHIVKYEKNITIIDRKSFFLLENIEKEFLLGICLSSVGRLSKSLLYEVIKFLDNKNSKRLDLPNKYMIEQSIHKIRIFKKSEIELFSIEKKAGIDKISINYIDIFCKNDYIYKDLIIRNRRNGDKFYGKKLKDLFINKNIDLFNRDRAVIIEDKTGIIWVEYLSYNNDIIVKRNSVDGE